ncbi:MAG: hypothetical protein KAJ18_11805, partial [Candidatus Omnitrophica bacterium]|nr:hypothetical protein [Candidatus Omnitrophota bacterium]
MSENKKTVIFFIIIVAINLIIFYPSFSFSAKADHITYLMETAGIENLAESINQTYSFCRTRIVYAGDRILFRPIFYLLLSVEKFLFGYNFVYWQITGFLFHLIIVGLLLRLFNAIQPHIFSWIFTLFYSVIYIGSDLVTWHHMHGYLLFLIFMLLALIHFVLYIKNDQKDRKDLWFMGLYLLGACFTNEFGIIVSAIILLTLLGHRRIILKRPFIHSAKVERGACWTNNPFMLMIPPISYLYVSFLDYTLRFSGGGPENKLIGLNLVFDVAKLIGQFIILFSASFILPFSPGVFKIFTDDKNYALFLHLPDIMNFDIYLRIMFFLNVGIFIAAFGALGFVVFNFIKLRRKIRLKDSIGEKKPARNILTVILLGSAMLAGYIAVLVIFRTSDKDLFYVTNNLYHFYILSLLAVIVIYGLFLLVENFLGDKKEKFRRLVLTVLCLGAFLNGLQVYQLNRSGREMFSSWGQYVRKIERFVNTHKHEKDFSYRF